MTDQREVAAMVLGNSEIRQRIVQEDLICPFNPDHLQPASYDITLDKGVLHPLGRVVWFPRETSNVGYIRLDEEFVTLCPGQFLLASTVEVVQIPVDLCAQVDGRSTLGRLGVTVHVTAGWIDPGFCGRITLEMHNAGPHEVNIPVNSRIGQIIFWEVEGCTVPYQGKYQGQVGATIARSDGEYERKF